MRIIRDLLLIISFSFTTFAISNISQSNNGEITDLNILMNDSPETSRHHAGDYLSEATEDLAYSDNQDTSNSFNYESKAEEYEPVALVGPNGMSQKNWNMIKGIGYRKAADAIIQGQSRRNREAQHQRQMRMEVGGKADYNPNLFHWSTWKCGFWDRMPWGTHKPDQGQNSPDCIKALQVGF